ncbi:PREDICTED: melanocortin-2 receptor accessory protein [Elephantulus edwardii]|uniref:melanocortin-2 receptor accessory protein n=1 Tax=Elephantulus edwardii TaxID=28737 RepID=UPI0003F0CE00|nr:PREDICTED: melanocortin-2 receptor accessory protein [Elephantulus edwardii]
MANTTNHSAPYYSYEYYLDYLDLMPVDEMKLQANKHLIVIAFWVSLAVFVVLLFFILLYMSWTGSSQIRNPQHHRACPLNRFFNLLLCVRRHSLHHRAPPASSQAPSSEEPAIRSLNPQQPLPSESPSALDPHGIS